MPLDPRDFLAIAERVATDHLNSEAALRTAVGRAYYATFLRARERLGVGGRHRIHRKVISALKRADSAAGNQLDKLEELRGIADYDLNVRDPLRSNWNDNWTMAEGFANHVLRRIERIR